MEKRKKMVRELVLKRVESLANKGPHHLPREVSINVFYWRGLGYSGPADEVPTDKEVAEVLNWLIVKKKVCLSGFLEVNGNIHTLVKIL